MRRFLLFLSLLFWPLAARAVPKMEAEPGAQLQRDIVFAQRGAQALRLHLIRPAKLPAKPLPTLIWVHGGLWRTGDAAKISPLLFELARRGYACASIEFRSTDEAVFPAQLDDLRAATRFLRAQAKGYRLSGKIGVAGISTGAHLAALLALSGGAQCAIDICGPSDLTSLDAGSRLRWEADDGPIYALLGGSASEKAILAREASPLYRVGPHPPPFLILHGEKDSLVALAQSEALYRRLVAANGDVTYRIYRGEDHGLRGAQPEIEAEVLKFLAKWLPL